MCVCVCVCVCVCARARACECASGCIFFKKNMLKGKKFKPRHQDPRTRTWIGYKKPYFPPPKQKHHLVSSTISGTWTAMVPVVAVISGSWLVGGPSLGVFIFTINYSSNSGGGGR